MQSTICANQMFIKLSSNRSDYWSGGSPLKTGGTSVTLHMLAVFLLCWVRVELPAQSIATLLDIQLVGLQPHGNHAHRQVNAPEKSVAIAATVRSMPTHDPISLRQPAWVSNTRQKLVSNAVPHRVPIVKIAQTEQLPKSAAIVSESPPRPVIDGPAEPVDFAPSGTGLSNGMPAAESTNNESIGTTDNTTATAASPPETPILAGIGTPAVGSAVTAFPESLADANVETLSAMEARSTQEPLNIYADSPWATVPSQYLNIDDPSDFTYSEYRGALFMQFGYREYLPHASFVDFERALQINLRLMAIARNAAGADSWQVRQFRTNEAILIACLGNDEKACELADSCGDHEPLAANPLLIRRLASLYFDLAEIAVYHDKPALAEQMLTKAEAAGMTYPDGSMNQRRRLRLLNEIEKRRQLAKQSLRNQTSPPKM